MSVTEYATLCVVDGQPVPVGQEPALARQQVTFTGTAGTSAAFNTQTRFVRIFVDGVAALEFGSAPTAVTSTGSRAAAASTEFYGVIPGHKVSAVT